MDEKRWWYISVKARYLGKCYEALPEIERALGPWIEISGNHINVFLNPCGRTGRTR